MGPFSMISEPGTKRLAYTHTEVVWTTVHHNPDNETDLEKLEEMIIAENYLAYEKHTELEER